MANCTERHATNVFWIAGSIPAALFYEEGATAEFLLNNWTRCSNWLDPEEKKMKSKILQALRIHCKEIVGMDDSSYLCPTSTTTDKNSTFILMQYRLDIAGCFMPVILLCLGYGLIMQAVPKNNFSKYTASVSTNMSDS
jgi:hypothetical protein